MVNLPRKVYSYMNLGARFKSKFFMMAILDLACRKKMLEFLGGTRGLNVL